MVIMMNNYDSRSTQPYGPYGYPPPLSPYELDRHRRPLRRWSNIIGVGLLLVNVMMFAIVMLLSSLFYNPTFFDLSQEHLDLIDQAMQLVAHSISFWIPTLIVMTWIKIPPAVAFPLRAPKPSILIPAVFVSLGASVLGSIVVTIISGLFEGVTGLIPTAPDFSMPEGIAANIVYVISMIVSPAIFEELMFRGVILQSLRRFGDGFALVVSSILFGLIHGNLIQGPNAMLLGLVIGYFVLRTGSIITGMVIHAVINGLSTVFSYVMDYIDPSYMEIFNVSIFAGYAILGCIGVVFLLVRHTGMFRVAPSSYPLPGGKRYSAFFTTAGQIVFLIATIILTSMYFE